MLQYKGSESAKNPYYAHSNLGYFLKPHKSKAAGYKDLLYMLLHTYVNMLFLDRIKYTTNDCIKLSFAPSKVMNIKRKTERDILSLFFG